MNPMLAAVASALLLVQGGAKVDIRDVAPEQYPQVSAIVRVIDDQGRAVPGLGAAEFRVEEDGQPVAILDVRPSFRDGGSLAVALLIDTSFSMAGAPLEGAKAAAGAFLERLTPDDRVAVVTFGLPPKELVPFGPPGAVTGIEALSATGYTGLYDAVNLGVAELAAVPASARAVVVLTDGADDGSDLQLETLRHAVAVAGIPIDVVAFSSPEFDPGPARDLAAASGGSYRETADPSELATLYRQIADELVAEYRITYRSEAAPGPHRLRISVSAPTVEASAERVFQAIGPGGPATTVEKSRSGVSLPIVPLAMVALAVLAVAGGIASVVLKRRRPWTPAVGVAGAPRAEGSGLVLEGPGVSVTVARGSMYIGRDPSAQVIVDDPSVSRTHARLDLRGDDLWVEDLGSANGTLINGVAVTRAVLRPGDVLEVGDLRLRLTGALR
ncbi:MAG: hypothetical protein QOF60_3160 [Actinomycetota bacterium]|jgi:Mg-chelatase subunit ChlD|nr:hypothetical protein [Actinomycetota bacterium]MEA3078252.1 hypothetical protein [Actinomycetota bacterium]